MQNKFTVSDNLISMRIHDQNYSLVGFNQLLISEMLDNYSYECHLVICHTCGRTKFYLCCVYYLCILNIKAVYKLVTPSFLLLLIYICYRRFVLCLSMVYTFISSSFHLFVVKHMSAISYFYYYLCYCCTLLIHLFKIYELLIKNYFNNISYLTDSYILSEFAVFLLDQCL